MNVLVTKLVIKQKTSEKFTIALSCLNFLRGALKALSEEINIYKMHVKNYPERQSSMRIKKVLPKLEELYQELKKIIAKSNKEFKF